MITAASVDTTTIEFPEWDCFVKEAKTVFGLSDSDAELLYGSRTARIIAAIPFAAGCEDAERTAILHLVAYIAEIRGLQKFCAHLPSDDKSLYERLDMITHFKGGDKQIIEHGMDMLALIMLRGYRDSQNVDAKSGVYNPLNAGTWDYDAAEKMLEGRIKNFHNTILDGLFYGPFTGMGW